MTRLSHTRHTMNRRGFSLVEALGVMFFLGTVMVLVGTAIHRVNMTQKMALSCVRYSKTLEGLHQRLCIDTKAAQQLEEHASGIQLSGIGNQMIEYSVDAGNIVRTVKSSDGAVVAQNRWSVGVLQFKAELDRSGEIPIARFQLNMDRQLILSSVPTGKAVATSEASGKIETIHWVSRLSRGPQ